MKIVFAGTPEFAAQALCAIAQAGHEIVLVLTQPDRRAGRGMQVQASPVKIVAIEKNFPLLQPQTLKRNVIDPEQQARANVAYQCLNELQFDAMVVVAYGLILPQAILDITERKGRYGCFNIHASLLPRWRGAAPIQRALQAGDGKTGISIMQMNAGLDTGDTVLIGEVLIKADDTSATLHDRLGSLGADLMVKVLSLLDQGKALQATPQPADGINYAEKILKDESVIDWSRSATEIDYQIRAFNPFPGSTSQLNGDTFKFWKSALAKNLHFAKTGLPGEVLGVDGDHVYIQCGQGVIEVQEMQKPGGKKLKASACLQPHQVAGKAMRFLKD
jgi:methionyl-tRNA formyltransferase